MRLRASSIGLFGLCILTITSNIATPRISPDNKPSVPPKWALAPILFEPNVGQASSRARFLGRGTGYTVLLSETEVTYIFRNNGLPLRIDMKLIGARESSSMSASDIQKSVSNYFVGSDQRRWHSRVPNYASVSTQNIYNGINLSFYGSNRELEHDFQVAPGADPGKSRFDFVTLP